MLCWWLVCWSHGLAWDLQLTGLSAKQSSWLYPRNVLCFIFLWLIVCKFLSSYLETDYFSGEDRSTHPSDIQPLENPPGKRGPRFYSVNSSRNNINTEVGCSSVGNFFNFLYQNWNLILKAITNFGISGTSLDEQKLNVLKRIAKPSSSPIRFYCPLFIHCFTCTLTENNNLFTLRNTSNWFKLILINTMTAARCIEKKLRLEKVRDSVFMSFCLDICFDSRLKRH